MVDRTGFQGWDFSRGRWRVCESGRHWALMIASNWRMLFCLSSSTSILTTPLVNHTLGSRSPAPRVHAAVRIIAETLVASRYPPLCTFIALCPQDTQPAPPTLPIVYLIAHLLVVSTSHWHTSRLLWRVRSACLPIWHCIGSTSGMRYKFGVG